MVDASFAERLGALMAERGVGVRALARQVPCNPGYLSRLRAARDRPSPKLARRLDDLLAAGGELVAALPAHSEMRPRRESAGRADELHSLADEAIRLSAWIEQTNVGNSTISSLAEATHTCAEEHTRVPPRALLTEVVRIHRRTQTLLREGKQRLRQTRELFRIDADLLAHACILLGDLHNDGTAITHAVAATLCAEEAGASPATALSAQAKTERWRGRYAVSADLARRGFECSPPTPLRVMLACQEANAAGLLGDTDRAWQALQRAETAADGPLAADSGVSPWSCPRPRQALYALSVAIHTDDPDAALQAAEMADAGWTSGEPWVYGTWAQVRFGAGIAYVMMGDLDGAAEQVAPVMTLEPEFRLATITNYLVDMDARLQQSRFHGSSAASALRDQIREFNSTAPALHGVVEEID